MDENERVGSFHVRDGWMGLILAERRGVGNRRERGGETWDFATVIEERHGISAGEPTSDRGKRDKLNISVPKKVFR